MRFALFFVAMAVLWCTPSVSSGEIDDEIYRELIMNGGDFESFRALMRSDGAWDDDLAVENAYRARGSRTRAKTKVTECEVSITAPENSSEEPDPDPVITSKVICEGAVLYDKEEKLSELKPQTLDNGIQLFADTAHGGAAYLYLLDLTDIRFLDSQFANLRPFVDREMTAVVVVEDGLSKFNDCTFRGNVGGKKAGVFLVGGSASSEITNSEFIDNEGEEVGAVRVSGSSKLDIEADYFKGNKGRIVGALMAEGRGKLSGKQVDCYANSAIERATAVFYTETAIGFLDEVTFEGLEREDDLRDYLVSDDFDKNKLEEYNLPKAGAVEVDASSLIALSEASFLKNAAKYGAVIASGEAVLDIRFSLFKQNTALNGAGVYVEGTRGGYARVLNTDFVQNIAHNGGALVVAGNGTFVIAECDFEENAARRGGAVWGDYSNSDLAAGGTCERTAQGSRVDIHESIFRKNYAYESGGAFFIKCTDIQTNFSQFHENNAAENGGAMFLEDVYDLNFLNSEFGQNIAGASGGSLFVKNSHDIILLRSNVTGGTAKKNGGAIASIAGNAIRLTDSKVVGNAAAGSGGAIHSEQVLQIEASSSAILENSAGDAGGAFSLLDLEELYLSEVDVSSNKAGGAGGVVKASNGLKATVKDMIIADIVSGSGPITLDGVHDVVITDIDFRDNEASEKCGALEVAGAKSLDLHDVTFRRNKANTEGGGLCIATTDVAKIEQVQFIENTAESGGAILFNKNKEVNLTNVIFAKNAGANDGGAIKGLDVEMLALADTVFESNEAIVRGGAVYLHGSSLDIQKCKFKENYVGPVRPLPPAPELEVLEVGDEPVAEAPAAAETEDSPPISNPASKESGGIVYVGSGKTFKSMDTEYEYNEAADVGGALMLEYLDSAYIQYDTFLNGTASLSGGCIYGNGIGEFELWDTTLQACSAKHGGAFILEGTSKISGGYSFFFNNTAESGGAFLCKGDSHVSMNGMNFSYNAAHEGATVAIDCHCDVDFTKSVFYRDKHLKGNGDFFHTHGKCGKVNANECKFYGEKPSNGMSRMQFSLLLLCCAILVLLVLLFIVRRRRRSKKQNEPATDVETGDTAPLIPPRQQQAPQKTLSFSEDYTSSYETESDEESETATEESDDDVHAVGKKGARRSAMTPDDDDSEYMSSLSEEDELLVKSPRQIRKRQQQPLPVSTNVPDPIGIRSAKEVRAAARRRQASTDVVNDGAGPSARITEDVMPPPLPNKLQLPVSVDEPMPDYINPDLKENDVTAYSNNPASPEAY